MAKDAEWNCSSKYTDPVQKYKVCPFIPTQCGSSPIVTLNGTGDQLCLKINRLMAGNACMYKVNSFCHQPNFTFNDSSNFIT
jgi:hypothetical protein